MFTKAACGVELNEFDYRQLNEKIEAVIHVDVQNIQGWAAELEHLDDATRILKIQKALVLLASLEQPTKAHINWTKRLLDSNDSLSIYTPEHRRKKLSVVNIARQAQTTLDIWQIKLRIKNFQQRWVNGRWDWKQQGIVTDHLGNRALVNWLSKMNQEQLLVIAEQVRQNPQAIEQLDNQILAIIGLRSGSEQLLSILWSRAADQYSYIALDDLPDYLSTDQVVQQLVLATQQNELMSQALLQLAQSHSYHPVAQDFILKAVTQPELRSNAVMTLSTISNPKLRDRLSVALKNSRHEVTDIGLKQLNRELAQ